MLKNAKRFVETFNNYVSYAHTFRLTNNFRNSRKKGKKREKNLASEAVFGRCSIEKVVLKILQNSQGNTCLRQKQRFIGVPEKRCSENKQEIYWRIPMPKCDLRFNKATLLKSYLGVDVLL